MQRVLGTIGALAVLLAMASPLPAEGQSTPTSEPGLVDAVGRTFTVAALTLTATLALSVTIAEYEDPQGVVARFQRTQRNALSGQSVGDCPGDPQLTEVREVSVPAMRDATFAFGAQIGEEGDDGLTGSVAAIVVQEGTYLYLVIAAALLGDPLGDALAVTERILDEDRTLPAQATVGMRHDGLWARLPVLSEVPTGLAFEGDDEDPFAPTVCASPVASPVA